MHILAIHDVDTIDLKPGEKNLAVTLLTKLGTKNNAFRTISPDGNTLSSDPAVVGTKTCG